MKLSKWKADQSLVEWTNKLLNSPEFQVLLDMIEEEHPKNRLDQRPTDGIGAALELGEIRGYDKAINTLKSAATPDLEERPPVISTFEPPETEDAN